MTAREPNYDTTVMLIPAPPHTAEKVEQLEWIMQTGCTLGRVCTDLARQAGASDNQVALIMHYMAGRTRGAYVDEGDKHGEAACDGAFSLGVAHGREAAAEQEMEERATTPGTETKQ